MACALLLRSNEKVEDIAVKVGFHDPNYFTRMFKQLMGVTPREYRVSRKRFHGGKCVKPADCPDAETRQEVGKRMLQKA